MFLFPIRTDRRLRHTPWVNYSLIAANVLVFLWTRDQIAQINVLMARHIPLEYIANAVPILKCYLLPDQPAAWQFITYQFLHADVAHLVGNMLFLYVFGNSVEDRLGKIGYGSFYLVGGVLAGLGHVLLNSAPALGVSGPVLGASGAVCAVTGAYLALFPMSRVTIVYWFILIGAFEVSSLLLICFQIAQNAVFYLLGIGGVAYLAHLSGYGFGFAIGMGLLASRLLPREPYDLLALIERQRRRAELRSVTRKGYSPWDHNKPGDPPPATAKAPPTSKQDQRKIALRKQIRDFLAAQNLGQAAATYTELLKLDASQVMPLQHQVDIANQFMSEGQHHRAAEAYELYLNTYPSDGRREQVELILGVVYTRYLHRRQRAKELLTSAIPKLHDPSQKAMAKQMLEEISEA